jgi:hypothetical protein
MKNNQIHIEIQENRTRLHTRTPIRFDDFLTVFGTVLLATMQGQVDRAPEEAKQTLMEDIYDKVNFMASNILSLFAPDLELRPHLTSEAILEAENKLIQEGKMDSFKTY